MLFTYEIEIPVGNGATVTKEIDAELTFDRNGAWMVSLMCETENEYISVFNRTDLYKDICSFVRRRLDGYWQEASENSKRQYMWSEKRVANK